MPFKKGEQNGRPFPKGVSGNPRGGSRKATMKRLQREAMQKNIIMNITEWITGKTMPKELDKAYGKLSGKDKLDVTVKMLNYVIPKVTRNDEAAAESNFREELLRRLSGKRETAMPDGEDG